MATPSMRSTIEATVADFMKSYEDAVSASDASILSRTLAADCTRQLAPAALLRNLGMPVDMSMGNEAYEQHMAGELHLLESVGIETLDLSVDAERRRAGARSANDLKLAGKGVFRLEFCWFLDFSDDGRKITKVVQFVDSAEAPKFLALAAEVAAAGGGKGSGA